MNISKKTLDTISKKIGKYFKGKYDTIEISSKKTEIAPKITKETITPHQAKIVNNVEPTQEPPKVEATIVEETATQLINNGEPV